MIKTKKEFKGLLETLREWNKNGPLSKDLKSKLEMMESVENLILFGVSRPFKTKFQLAEFMHNEYEKHAQKSGWNTQETCKVEFLDLPKENKETMLLVAESVLNAY
jgi:hypothetical protein